MVAPIFCAVLAGAIDFGGALLTKYRLDAAVAAAANYALINASSVSSTNAATLASSLATIVRTSQGSTWADVTVVVNNGATATATGSGAISASGTASQADSCYCPTGTSGSLTWGSAVTCASNCTGGGYAGKFVTISASRTYATLLPDYNLIGSPLRARVTVQVQ
jgi:Flp pilus assembly protein TadG